MGGPNIYYTYSCSNNGTAGVFLVVDVQLIYEFSELALNITITHE